MLSMYEPGSLPREQTEQLIADLRLLCAQPSSTNQQDELTAAARVVADLLRQSGLEVRSVRTPGAPVVLGWRDGHVSPRLLLYHHYDVAPPGPWRAWFHEPFQLAERDNILYGRGVAHGKGPLVSHLHALRTLLQSEGELPCGLAVVVEGEGLSGSTHLADVLRQHADELCAGACLSVAGERDSHGRPFCYGGSKGLLRVRLSVRGASHSLPSGLSASVPNPVWRLIWALNHIKGEDEDIRINGFYDTIAGPGKGEREMLRKAHLDEQGRLAAWQIPSFLFGMSDAGLVRSEVTLPTCNISGLVVETSSDVAAIPVAASAQVDFQLVPDQHPQAILELLRMYLDDRNCSDITVEAAPGSYAPVRNSLDQSFIQRLSAAGERIYGESLSMLPIGPFVQPLSLFAEQLETPVAAVALSRHDSAMYGPNEHLPLDDMVRHSQLIAELLMAYRDQPGLVEVGSS